MALTMIKVQPDYEKSAYDDLLSRSGIRDVYRLFGEYSFFVVVQAEGRLRLDQLLQDIKENDKVMETGPVLLTSDDEPLNTAFANVMKSAAS